MKIKFVFCWLLCVFFEFAMLNAQEIKFNLPAKGINNWQPAPSWEQAYLLGNGEMGASVFGHPHNETLIISHADIYLPLSIPHKPIDQQSRLNEIRALILAGKGKEAALIPLDQMAKEGYTEAGNDPYIAAFNLNILSSAENIEKYNRYLNFETGEAVITWQQNGSLFQRKQFISRADSVLIIEISSEKAFSINFELKMQPVEWNQWGYINEHIKFTHSSASNNAVYYESEFTKQWEPNVIGYQGVGLLKYTDGTIEKHGNSLRVSNAKKIVFMLKVEAQRFGEKSHRSRIEAKLENLSDSYNALLQRQIKVHGELFNRVQFTLHGDSAAQHIQGEVLTQQSKEQKSLAIIEKQFYAARYNILSATGKNPPNLQGIWGNSWTPPWASDYTHDGNLPAAISSFLMSNMPELLFSYFDYNDKMLPAYRENARKLFGCRGIVMPAHSSTYGTTAHFDKTWCLTFWTGGAAWAASFYYDYWLYSGDKTFLIARAYPFIKEVALFYEDFMQKDSTGKYIFNPSYSPENNPANNESQAVVNATMDVALAKEVFRNLLAAAPFANESKAQIAKWQQILNDLPDYEIDENGYFREWLWKGYEENHNHRHLSHLYGMYNRIDPEIAADSVLWNAVKKSVDARMKIRNREQGGIMVFGLAQLAWVAANLGNAEMEEEIIGWLSKQYWSNSLATYHDPNGLFNSDLSGAFQTVIIKALMHSEVGNLYLFPAKPASWKTGRISGIKARGNIEIVELGWTENSVKLQLKSSTKQTVKVNVPFKIKKVESKNVRLFTKLNQFTFKLAENQVIEIQLEY